jgi:thiamine-monophosphate kinase
MSQYLPEISDLVSWLGSPPRSPNQTHGLNESDSEVLDLKNGTYLATTLDSISEEIAVGLYRDPYTLGWVVVMASLSDLAAVGASPLGFLISTEWDRSFDQERKSRFAVGMADALRECSTYLLGGDSGNTRSSVLTGVGVGICHSKPMSRVGVQPGDWICVVGQTGIGPALAMRFLLGYAESDYPESMFRPVAQLSEGQLLRPFASACMDTSDGIIASLHTLQVLNSVDFDLFWNRDSLASSATQFLETYEIPQWLLWAGQHGDYQLLVTIPPDHIERAKISIPRLYPIGRAVEKGKSRLRLPNEQWMEIDLSQMRHLARADQPQIQKGLADLIRVCKELGLP